VWRTRVVKERRYVPVSFEAREKRFVLGLADLYGLGHDQRPRFTRDAKVQIMEKLRLTRGIGTDYNNEPSAIELAETRQRDSFEWFEVSESFQWPEPGKR
jgi:hypothetical protein